MSDIKKEKLPYPWLEFEIVKIISAKYEVPLELLIDQTHNHEKPNDMNNIKRIGRQDL